MYKQIKNNTKFSHRGFTVLETLVAIAILLIAVTGPLVVISQSLKTSYHSRDEITAFYLAQEAVEYARYKRDTNVLGGGASAATWLNGVIPTLSPATCENLPDANPIRKCQLDRSNDSNPSDPYSYSLCATNGFGDCAVLKQDDNGIYGQGDNDSIFTREIYFTKVPSTVLGDDREILMTVHVIWVGGNGGGEYTLNERLFNWKAAQ